MADEYSYFLPDNKCYWANHQVPMVRVVYDQGKYKPFIALSIIAWNWIKHSFKDGFLNYVSKLWTNCTALQNDLSFHWSHTFEVTVPHVGIHISFCLALDYRAMIAKSSELQLWTRWHLMWWSFRFHNQVIKLWVREKCRQNTPFCLRHFYLGFLKN